MMNNQALEGVRNQGCPGEREISVQTGTLHCKSSQERKRESEKMRKSESKRDKMKIRDTQIDGLTDGLTN